MIIYFIISSVILVSGFCFYLESLKIDKESKELVEKALKDNENAKKMLEQSTIHLEACEKHLDKAKSFLDYKNSIKIESIETIGDIIR